jgi:hypothetical protein
MTMQAGSSEQGRDRIISRLTAAVEQALGIVRCIAFPSLTQLVLRLALAVPFWKSGILKWDGFLRLNDTARDNGLGTRTLFCGSGHRFGGLYCAYIPQTGLNCSARFMRSPAKRR